jgi:hypothetical protein
MRILSFAVQREIGNYSNYSFKPDDDARWPLRRARAVEILFDRGTARG